MKRGFLQAAAVLVVLFTASVASAGFEGPGPGAVLNFEGSDCTVDCIEGASASLTFNEGFSLGTPFTAADLHSFSFSSDSGAFNGFSFSSFALASGTLFGTDNELADVFLMGTAFVVDSTVEIIAEVSESLFSGPIAFVFNSSSDPELGWSMTAAVIAVDNDGPPQAFAVDDVGGTGIWSPTNEVSEPGMLALFGVGLIGMGLVRRRKTKTAAL